MSRLTAATVDSIVATASEEKKRLHMRRVFFSIRRANLLYSIELSHTMGMLNQKGFLSLEARSLQSRQNSRRFIHSPILALRVVGLFKMGIFQTSLAFAFLLATQCQPGQAIPFNGQARAITTTTIGNYTYQGWSVSHQ